MSYARLLAGLVVLAAVPALADESEGKMRPVWPTVNVNVTTSGAASATMGLNLQRGISGHVDWDVSILPQVSVATSSSVAQLFSDVATKVSGPTTWSGGLTLSLLGRETRTLLSHPSASAKARKILARQAALKVCQAECKANKDETGLCLDESRFQSDDFYETVGAPCAKGVDVYNRILAQPSAQDADTDNYYAACSVCFAEDKCAEQANASTQYCAQLFNHTIQRNDLCPDGAAIAPPKSAENQEATSPYSRWLVSVGGEVDGNAFTYYKADPAMNLAKQTDTHVGGVAAASLTWVDSPRRFTIEVPFVYTNAWTPSTTPLHSCANEGQIPRAGGSDPAQKCIDSILGAPTQSQALYASVQLGYVDLRASIDPKLGVTVKSLWRFAVGPSVHYQTAAQDLTILALEAPFYVNFASAPAGYASKNFSGIVRLTPTVGASHQGSTWATYALVTLSLVADVTFFRRALDWK